MHYFHDHNTIFICLELYIMTIITFISLNILVYFTGITKLITFLFDRQKERGKLLNSFRTWVLFLNYRY